MAARVAISLGSNLGDRRAHLTHAAERLAAELDHFTISPYLETEPVGVAANQPAYLNASAAGFTTLPARRLLDRLLEIERERGRARPYPKAPRTLDLDLILYGDEVITEPDLIVPHPRFREREFVLEPLAVVAGGMRDPITGLTVSELLAALRSGGAGS